MNTKSNQAGGFAATERAKPDLSGRQTMPYVSSPASRLAAAGRETAPDAIPEDLPPPEQAAPAETPGHALVRIAPPHADGFEGRAARSQPLQIEAPLLIRIRSVDRLWPDQRLWLMTRPGSATAEQFRVLSLKLKGTRDLRVVALAGPDEAAEAASVAANVALALGEGTRNRVLLLDANLRCPRIGELFGLPDSPGLAEQVRQHRRQPREPWEMTGLSGTVSLLTAGAVEKNAAALLSSEAVGELMQEARRAFDYIVVAAPPVLASADLALLQDHLDGSILVVRVGVTRRESVQAAIETLGAQRFIGTVMVEL